MYDLGMADDKTSDLDPDYGPNPELYEKLVEPCPTVQEADHSLIDFLCAVELLREDRPDVWPYCTYTLPELRRPERACILHDLVVGKRL